MAPKTTTRRIWTAQTNSKITSQCYHLANYTKNAPLK